MQPMGARRNSLGGVLLDWAHGRHLHLWRVKRLGAILAPLIPLNADVLDVGCGDGRLAQALCRQRPDIRLVGLDVFARPEGCVPVQVFDGLHIPMDARTFDLVMFVDVLHHSDRPASLLAEAARVSKGSVLIKDHLRQGILAERRLRFMDWVGNARHGVRCPHTYFSQDEWLTVFERSTLGVKRWVMDLHLYPPPLDWVFGGSLQFVVLLCCPASTDGHFARSYS